MTRGYLVRVRPADLDVTLVGLRVLLVQDGHVLAGGISDVHQCPTDGPCPAPLHAALYAPAGAHTHVWAGGVHAFLLPDAVVVTSPPAAALEAMPLL